MKKYENLCDFTGVFLLEHCGGNIVYIRIGNDKKMILKPVI